MNRKDTMRKAILSIVILLFLVEYGVSQSTENLIKTKDELQGDTTSSSVDSSELIHLAFKKKNANEVIGFISQLDASGIEKYDHTIWLNEVFSGRTLGLLGTQPIRGLGRGIGIEDISGNPYSGHPVIVVDGLPRDMSSLRLSEVKDITVLRDVNSAALYDSDAINGVILISTKRGKANEKQANLSLNYGISTPRDRKSTRLKSSHVAISYAFL